MILKKGLTIIYSTTKLISLGGASSKRLEDEDMPGELNMWYYDPKTQDRPIGFECEHTQQDGDIVTTISNLRLETVNDAQLYTLEWTLNGVTLSFSVVFEDFSWNLTGVNMVRLSFKFKETDTVMPI